MRIILFNGPPGCGKDTAAQALAPEYTELKFAWHLKECVHKIFGLDGPPVAEYEKYKDDPEFLGGNVTLRQAYIQLSEHFFKPLFGPRYFGEIVARWIEERNLDKVTISDSGFAEEAQALVDTFGKENITLVRLHREGCTFEGDSRGYLELDGIATIDLTNRAYTAKEFKDFIRFHFREKKMKKLRLVIEGEFEKATMYGEDKEAKEWFFEEILKGGNLRLVDSGDLGDEVFESPIKVLEIEEL